MERHETGDQSLAEEWPFGRCFRWGLYIGSVYAFLAVMVELRIDDFEARYGLSLLQTVVIDLVGGGAGGAAVGLLLPRVRGVVGHIVAAQVSLIPAYVLFALSAPASESLTLWDGVGAALVVGAFVGVAVWRGANVSRRARKDEAPPPG